MNNHPIRKPPRKNSKKIHRTSNPCNPTLSNKTPLPLPPNRITLSPDPLPPPAPTPSQDDALFATAPWVEPPIHIDYGTNLTLGAGVFVNFNCTILDTCRVTVGARTLIASNVSIYSGTHPLDPDERRGTEGPELGAEVAIGEDCWLGGNVVVLPGVEIGRGATVGAGSVVTKVGGGFFFP